MSSRFVVISPYLFPFNTPSHSDLRLAAAPQVAQGPGASRAVEHRAARGAGAGAHPGVGHADPGGVRTLRAGAAVRKLGRRGPLGWGPQ